MHLLAAGDGAGVSIGVAGGRESTVNMDQMLGATGNMDRALGAYSHDCQRGRGAVEILHVLSMAGNKILQWMF